jgi:hypothetical protein
LNVTFATPEGTVLLAEAIFAALIANHELLEVGRRYGLRFGISALGAMLLADRCGDAGKQAAANMVELDC